MLAIFKAEYKRGISSPLPLASLGSLTLIGALLAMIFNLWLGNSDISYFLRLWIIPALLCLPILPLWSRLHEEQTDEEVYLLTLPVSPLGIVLGKFTGTLALLATPLCLFAFLPLLFSLFGTVNFPTAYLSLLGCLLLLAMALSAVQLIARLCRRPILRASLSWGLVICFAFWNALVSLLPDGVYDGSTAFSPLSVFEIFTYGHIPVSGILFFLSLTWLLLSASVLVLSVSRGSLAPPHRIRTVAPTALALLAALLLNIGATLLPSHLMLINATGMDVFALSGKTLDVLRELDTDVTVTYFCAGGKRATDRDLYAFLESYARESDRIQLRIVDTEKDPSAGARYGRKTVTDHSLAVESADRYYMIDYDALTHYYNAELKQTISKADYDYCLRAYEYYLQNGTRGSYNQGVVEYGAQLNAYASKTTAYFDGDAMLLNAILYVSSPNVPTVCLFGDALDALEPFVAYLTARGYFFQTLASLKALPKDCDLLLLYSPAKDLTDDEVAEVTAFAESGGDILLATSSSADEMPNLSSVTALYGLSKPSGKHLVCEGNQEPPYTPLESFYAAVTETEALGAFEGYCYLLRPHAITVTETPGVTVTEWITSSDDAVLKYSDGSYTDTPERYTCAAIAEREESSLIWVSSALALGQYGYANSQGGNYSLLISALDTAVEQTYAVTPVTTREIPSSALTLDADSVPLWSFLLLIIPILILLPLSIRIYRRRKR